MALLILTMILLTIGGVLFRLFPHIERQKMQIVMQLCKEIFPMMLADKFLKACKP